MLIITRAPTTLPLHHLCTFFSQKWSHVFQSWLRGRLPWMPIYRSGTETTAESQRDMQLRKKWNPLFVAAQTVNWHPCEWFCKVSAYWTSELTMSASTPKMGLVWATVDFVGTCRWRLGQASVWPFLIAPKAGPDPWLLKSLDLTSLKLCLLPGEYNLWDIRANYYCYSGTESSASNSEIWKLTQRVKSDKTKHSHGWTGPKKEHPVASFPVQIFQPHLFHTIHLYHSEETDLGASSTTREGTPLLIGQWHPKRKDEAALIIGVSWCLRWWRIYLYYRRPGFDP